MVVVVVRALYTCIWLVNINKSENNSLTTAKQVVAHRGRNILRVASTTRQDHSANVYKQ